MTRAPRTVAPGQTLMDAHALMRGNRIRHLPVVRDGKVVGIVSQRDLILIETLPDVNAAEVPVEDAMTRDVFLVEPHTPLADVAAEMAERKLGSAVVMDAGRVVGMFTVTDACRALAELLGAARPRARRRRPARPGGAAPARGRSR
jgi:acetoin utilization protein AcuB